MLQEMLTIEEIIIITIHNNNYCKYAVILTCYHCLLSLGNNN